MLETDSHAVQSDGRYKIRSLYFDDYKQSGLLDKVEGVETREKFRIRFYDMDDSFIRLESKQKHNQMTKKQAAPLTREQTDRLLAGDLWFLYDTGDPLLKSFYLKSRTRLLGRRSLWTTTGRRICSRMCASRSISIYIPATMAPICSAGTCSPCPSCPVTG